MEPGARRAVLGGVVTSVMAGLVLMAPVAVEAQDPDWGVHRAEKMEAEANALAQERDRWEHAAWLYAQAATLRPAGDPEAVVDLQWAGKLAYYTGDLRASLDALKAAGTRAMEGGDALTAGNLYVDAAWVASKLGKDSDAIELVERAEQVVALPVLSDRVRNTVLARFDRETGAVTVAADFADGLDNFGPGL